MSIGFTDREGYADLLYCPDITKETAGLVKKQIAWLLTTSKIKLRGAHLKFDLNWILVKWGIDCTNFAMDTLIVGSLLDELRSNGLKNHVKAYSVELGGYDSTLLKGDIERMHLVPKERHLLYLGGDVDGTLRVSNKLLAEITPQKNLTRFYTQVMHRGSVAFQRIEREGIRVSLPRIKQLQTDLETAITNLSCQGLKLLPARLRAKYQDNPSLSRPALLKDYFFSPMGLNLKPRLFTAKSTPSDPKPSTAKNHLEMFFDVPEAKAMCSVLDELGQAEKCLSTYVIGFLKHLRSDGRWHPQYFLHRGGGEWGGDDGGAVTGRLSAKDPAIQTVPSPEKTIWGARIQARMVAPPGHVLVKADFSQGELRLTACVADETAMLAAYRAGIDLHCKTGASMNALTLPAFMALKDTEPATFKMIRAKAKPANFGIIYGISPDGYRAYAWNGYRVAVSPSEAEKTVTTFFETYPELPEWHKRYKKMARHDGYVVSPMGRVRHLPHINSPFREIAAKAERQAVNSPVQATLSDMMVWAISRLNDSHPQFVPCAMIHDSGVWAVPEDQAEDAAITIAQEMGNLPLREVFGFCHQIPFPADASLGLDMGQMVEVKVPA